MKGTKEPESAVMLTLQAGEAARQPQERAGKGISQELGTCHLCNHGGARKWLESQDSADQTVQELSMEMDEVGYVPKESTEPDPTVPSASVSSVKRGDSWNPAKGLLCPAFLPFRTALFSPAWFRRANN